MRLATSEHDSTWTGLTAVNDLTADLERAKTDARNLPFEIARAMVATGALEMILTATLRPPLLDCFVSGSPLTSGSKKAIMSRSTGKPMMLNSNPAQEKWQRDVRTVVATAYHGELLRDVPLLLVCEFEFLRPSSHFGRRGILGSAPRHKLTKPDVLKLGRAVEDALIGEVYADDSQNVAVLCSKGYGERMGVRVRVWRLDS